ncbi:TPA: hypothetical protein DIS56_02155 [Candidatus Saccharibacteria bacterium]|nr:MAG: hypothetical protein UX30_C0003G0081 [Candidatus Saccharibacteria bacterium GW2011_GWA2_46_10]OGL35210.1 MAG: hypothetical protein A3F05_00870 [Candidatus Saccharibacteria bacterium RIFCSPHIGHO2_12_FULL_47_17]HCM51914.1 hypothetical protein [Candidatus Saccharibacteria bacterium]
MPDNKLQIIGIAGTNGSGKDSLGQILAKHHGYMFVSVADFLREEAKKRGLPIEREVLRSISAEWRREKGLGVLVDMAMDKFKKTAGKYKGVVISPMRNAGEAARLKEIGGTLVWVDADPKIRYQRITRRSRSPEDKKTYEQFIAEEEHEMQRRGDKATLSLAEVKSQADIFIENNSTVEEFRQKIEKALGLA